MRRHNATRMAALGEEFRTAREARGLTLSDVAEQIHIRSVYLGAIETEDWSSIGAPVYVRGFIRTYARFLGLDAESAVARFGQLIPSEPVSRTTTAATTDRNRSGGGPSLPLIVGILIAVVLLGFVGYEYWEYTTAATPPVAASPAASHSPGAVAAGPSPAATSAPTAAATTLAVSTPAPDASPGASPAASPSPTPAASPTVAPAARHKLAVRFTQTSWLRVSVDGTTKLEGIFPAGTIKSFAGKSANVRVGNAGGVDFTVDGKHLGNLGGSGDVVERTFALGGE